jgi:hypothetical protein
MARKSVRHVRNSTYDVIIVAVALAASYFVRRIFFIFTVGQVFVCGYSCGGRSVGRCSRGGSILLWRNDTLRAANHSRTSIHLLGCCTQEHKKIALPNTKYVFGLWDRNFTSRAGDLVEDGESASLASCCRTTACAMRNASCCLMSISSLRLRSSASLSKVPGFEPLVCMIRESASMLGENRSFLSMCACPTSAGEGYL